MKWAPFFSTCMKVKKQALGGRDFHTFWKYTYFPDYVESEVVFVRTDPEETPNHRPCFYQPAAGASSKHNSKQTQHKKHHHSLTFTSFVFIIRERRRELINNVINVRWKTLTISWKDVGEQISGPGAQLLLFGATSLSRLAKCWIRSTIDNFNKTLSRMCRAASPLVWAFNREQCLPLSR